MTGHIHGSPLSLGYFGKPHLPPQAPVQGKPYFLPVAPGVSLGYRRNLGPGAWLVRCADGAGGSWSKGLNAVADDFEDGDGSGVLTFWDAQVRARELVRGKATDATKPITVAEALDEYETTSRPAAAWSPHRGGSGTACRRRCSRARSGSW